MTFSTWAVPAIGFSALLIIAFAMRRIRFGVAFVLALILVVMFVSQTQQFAVRPRPYGIEILSRWEGYSHPLRSEAMLAAVCVAAVLLLTPLGRARRRAAYAAAALLAYTGLAAVYLGSAHPSDVFMAIVIAATVTVLVVRRVAPPTVFPVIYRRGSTAHLDITGNRGLAIRRGVEDQLGYRVLDVEPVGLAGSAGSTPLKLEVLTTDGTSRTLFAKLYETTHLRSDRWYKVGRTLMYGQLEDERKFGSVRRLVQAEDYLAYKVTQAGIRTPQCHGIVELTPEREYVLVFDFLDGAVEMGRAQVNGEAHRPWDSNRAFTLGPRAGTSRHQAGQPHGHCRRGCRSDRCRLCPGATFALAAGGRPCQYDARTGTAQRCKDRLSASAAAVHRR